jgi:hypothetical protein
MAVCSKFDELVDIFPLSTRMLEHILVEASSPGASPCPAAESVTFYSPESCSQSDSPPLQEIDDLPKELLHSFDS